MSVGSELNFRVTCEHGYFLVASGCLLMFSEYFWTLALTSWRLLGACCYFLEASGCLLLFLGGFWVLVVTSKGGGLFEHLTVL